MTPFDIVQQRLHNQHLAGAPFLRPEEVVHWLGAVQAQEYYSAAWGIAQRTDAASQATIDQAFADGAILRTHVMRPTWHFVTPADIRWLLRLTSPRVHAINASYYRKLELDDRTLASSANVLTKTLQGGKHLTRTELATALAHAGIIRENDERMRLTFLVMHAELEGLICSGAMRGKQHTYALLDERVPATKTLERDEALAELTWRYVSSHGPATVKDVAWWSGLSSTDVRAGLEMNRPQLESTVIDEQTYWFAPNTHTTLATTALAHLLPGYDEYTVAYKDHSVILDPHYRDQIVVAFGIVIVINGMIVGMWKRVIKNDHALLTLSPLRAMTQDEHQALELACERYSRFLGKPVIVANSEA